MTELTWLDATAQAELVRTGEASPAELVEAAIGRIEAVNPKLDAVIRTRFGHARGDGAGDLPDGPCRGVPFLFKDLGCTVAGEVTAFGVGPMRDQAIPLTSYLAEAFLAAGFFPPGRPNVPGMGTTATPPTSSLAEAFLAAGFIPLGRTNVPEMGTTVTTEPMSFPPARNPWDPGNSPGGAAGGSAAAVASGMVPAAHANDGGGSIRIPASECGLVGLKPNRARVSQGPLIGDLMGGLVAEHVVTRSVRDSAAILDAT